MLERIKAWYQAAVNWLGVSEPGGRKEQVEDALTEGRLRDIIERQIEHRKAGRGRFAQILRGGGKPMDRVRGFALGFSVPVWADFSMDEWVGPAGKGFVLNLWVTETDNTEWVMRLRWNDGQGSDFAVEPWEQIQEAP
jgi:hypothetical protein